MKPGKWIQSVANAFDGTRDAAVQSILEEGCWPVAVKHSLSEPVRPHSHPIDQTLYVVDGEIEFTVAGLQPARGSKGDKLIVPRHVEHSVKIGPAGVTYIMGWPDMVTWEEFEGQDSDSYHAEALQKGVFPDFFKSGDEGLLMTFLEDLGRDRIVADIGCGTGSVAERAVERGLSVVGIDSCPPVVDAFNSRRLAKARAGVGDARRLPFLEDSFDAVLCVFLLQDLTQENGAAVLRELYRIARPKAPTLIAVTVNQRIADEQIRAHRECRGAGIAPKYFYHWHPEDLLKTTQAVGFKIGKTSEWGKHGDYVQFYVTSAKH